MSLNYSTKELFASTLQTLLKTTSIQKIKVKDLCNACNAQRQTFYYHFQDKYDLISWIYCRDVESALKSSDYYMNESYYINLLKRMLSNKAFYTNAFKDNSQNSLMTYIRESNCKLTEKLYKRALKVDTLDDETLFTIQFQSYAWTGSLFEWVTNNYPLSPERYAEFVYKNIQPIIRKDINTNHIGPDFMK